MRHRRVLRRVVQQAGKLAIDGLLLGTHQTQGARLHALGALGGIPHDEHGLAEGRSLLLDATRVGEDDVRAGHKVMEVHDLQRVDDAQVVEAVQFLVRCLAHLRIHVYGVDGLGARPLLHHAADGAKHTVHGLA